MPGPLASAKTRDEAVMCTLGNTTLGTRETLDASEVDALGFGEIEVQAVFLELLVQKSEPRLKLLWGLSNQCRVIDEQKKRDGYVEKLRGGKGTEGKGTALVIPVDHADSKGLELRQDGLDASKYE